MNFHLKSKSIASEILLQTPEIEIVNFCLQKQGNKYIGIRRKMAELYVMILDLKVIIDNPSSFSLRT